MNEFIIYKGCTNPVFIQLLNDDGTTREYNENDTVIFALSPDRKKESVIMNEAMEYDAESGMYYLIITPIMTNALTGDKKYYYDIKCITEDEIYPAQPLTPVWVVPELAGGVS